MISRRKFIRGGACLIAAPSIVRASSLEFIPSAHSLLEPRFYTAEMIQKIANEILNAEFKKGSFLDRAHII